MQLGRSSAPASPRFLVRLLISELFRLSVKLVFQNPLWRNWTMSHSSPSGISRSALSRVLALQASALKAAHLMVASDGYSDFFVEGGGGSWHEAFGDVVTISEDVEFSAARMAAIDAMRLSADGYSDFFVEGGGGSWHEAFGDVVTISEDVDELASLVGNVGARAAALSKLNVVRAYATLKSGGFARQ